MILPLTNLSKHADARNDSRLNAMSLSLEYDRGTITLNGLTPTVAPKFDDLIKWDERINMWRSPASSYPHILSRLRNGTETFNDHVRSPQAPVSDWSPISLRSYQESALLAWRAAAGRGIICLPTGAGKTRIALAAAQRSKKSTLCLVPTRVLLHQWIDSIREHYSGDVGVLGDGHHDVKPITVATFESAFRNGWTLGNRFDLLIVDEAHHFGDGERDEALEACSAPFRLGLSATLDDERLERLEQLVGPKVFEQRIDDLVGTALAEFELSCHQLPLTYAEKSAYKLDYDVFRRVFDDFKTQHSGGQWEDFLREASRTASGRAAIAAHGRAKKHITLTESKMVMLCQLLNRHSSQRKLVFTSDASSALIIARQLLLAPITSEIGPAERKSFIEDFRSGAIKTIVSCKVLNEGFDVPDAEIAIILGGSGSSREHIQRIGRVLRPKEGKKAHIYELLAAGTTEIQKSRQNGNKLNQRRYEKYGGDY